ATPARGTIILPWSTVASQKGRTIFLAIQAGRWNIYQPQEGDIWLTKDVRDKKVWEKALNKVEGIFHFAAYQDYLPDFSKFFQVNVAGTALLYEVIVEKKLNIKKVVVASSQAVYGEGQYRCRNRECRMHRVKCYQPLNRVREQLLRAEWEIKCPVCKRDMQNLLLQEEFSNPCNQYALSKYAQELTALRLGRLHNIPTVALRYSIIQGPRQSPFNPYSGILRRFCLRLFNDLPPIIYEDGKQQRDYTHIKDAVAANLKVFNSEKVNYEVYNVGSGCSTTVLEYADRLMKRMNRYFKPIIKNEFRLGDNRHSVSSNKKLKSLGWSPGRTIDEIISEYIEWIESKGRHLTYFLTAEKEMQKLGVVIRAGR
ncbi:MAG: NAD-dependent epimerase/dehydratase family protein, partial [candidate division WOR-3 bacterium]